MYTWFKFQVKSDKGASYLGIIVTLCYIPGRNPTQDPRKDPTIHNKAHCH